LGGTATGGTLNVPGGPSNTSASPFGGDSLYGSGASVSGTTRLAAVGYGGGGAGQTSGTGAASAGVIILEY